MAGDAAAVNAGVKIVQARSRLLGLFHAAATGSGEAPNFDGRSVVLCTP
jgi:hypothetical protein